VTLAVVLGGCGTPSADLFDVTRDGAVPDAKLTLLVSDSGEARCNGGTGAPIGDARLLRARDLVRQLDDAARRSLALPPGPGAVLRYRVRLERGTVAFSDTSAGQPPAFRRIAAFVRDVAKGVCGLER